MKTYEEAAKARKSMKYYIVFYKNGKAICGTWKEGKDKDEAIENAEFSIICHFPNIEYDKTEVTKTAE